MAKIFSSYTNVVRKMLKSYNEDLYNMYDEQNIEEKNFFEDYRGLEYCDIVININVDFFEDLKKKGVLEKTENTIKDFYDDAMRGDNNSVNINKIILKPIADSISTFGENIDDSMWKNGYFRLFISHITALKESATNLKKCLAEYGIDCFVAHEDIKPSKEWEIEIEKALFTMDALCAIVVTGFIKSNWCDQEVGIALGQKKLVIPINKGKNPYGFFGKYQALKSKNNANEMAVEVWKVIHTSERTRTAYFNKLINFILNATKESDALHYINVLKQCENVNKQHIENLHDNLTLKDVLNSPNIIKNLNSIFKKYALTPVTKTIQEAQENDDTDLPF